MEEAGTGGAHAPIEDWHLRPWVLAGLLSVAGLLLHLLNKGYDPDPLKAAGTAFVIFSSLGAAFTLGPQRLRDPAIFSVGAGIVMAGLAWHWTRVQQDGSGEPYGLAAGIFATGLALPLFQAGFHRTRFATSYELTHFHVWTDAVTAAGALAFTGLSWLLLALLASLFELVGLDFLTDLMSEELFGWMFSGAACGAGLGVLRNNLRIIGNLQNVVLLVLSLLAVPLAVGLAVFLVALVASGGQALWDATDSATPVLLACAAGCFVLTCAVMREGDAAMTGNRVQRWAAMLLGYGIFPLAVFAAISMGIRIGQHGLSPERIWALICIAIAVAYGVAYWARLIRGRLSGWPVRLRRANLHLAALTCVLALVLALPWHDFGAISTRDQLARLESGEVSPEEFDYAALKWDFGDAGREALKELANSDNPVIRERVAFVQDTENRWEARWGRDTGHERFTGELIVDPADASLPEELRASLVNPVRGLCVGAGPCRVFMRDEGTLAVIIRDSCEAPDIYAEEAVEGVADCANDIEILQLHEGEWIQPRHYAAEPEFSAQELREAIENGDVRIEPAPLRQVYIGGKPVDRAFR